MQENAGYALDYYVLTPFNPPSHEHRAHFAFPIPTFSLQLEVVDMGKKELDEAAAAVNPTPTTSDSPLPQPPFNKTAEGKLLRKLDMKVVPILWLLFLVCFVDRSNIGNAKIQGMDQELKLKGQRYNICVFVFNIGYLVAGVPLSIVFKKYGPKSLCVMMFCWGKFSVLLRSWKMGLILVRCIGYRMWPCQDLGRSCCLPAPGGYG